MAITITDFENIGAIALPAVSAAGNVRIVFDIADNLLKMSQNGAAYVPFGTSVTGGGWTDDGTNVRLTTSTDTVSIGTTTAPPAGTKVTVQADVAPSGGPPNTPRLLLIDANVTPGPVTAFTGAGLGIRVSDTAGVLQEIAGVGGLYTDVTLGAENAGMGFSVMHNGAAPALCVSLGGDGLGVFDVTAGSNSPQIQLNSDIGGTFPEIRLGDGAGATDWGLQRVNANTAGLVSTSRLQFGGNTTPTQDNVQVYNDGTFRVEGLALTGSGLGASAPFLFTTGSRTQSGVGVGDNTGNISIGTGGTDCNNAGGTGGNSGAMTLATGSTFSGAGASGSSGAFSLATGNSADANSGDSSITTGTAAVTRGAVNLNARAIVLTGSLQLVGTEIAFGASPYAPLTTDSIIFADPTGGNMLVNLPSVASSRNRVIIVAHASASANTVSVVPNGADTIDLVNAPLVLTTQQVAWLIAQPTGTNWKIF